MSEEIPNDPGSIAESVPDVMNVEAYSLLTQLRQLIQSAREHVALYVNQQTTLLYWDLGHRIRTEILGQERVEYGQRVVAMLAQSLTREFGRGYGRANLFNMVRFVEAFPERQIVQTLSGQLSWSHFVDLAQTERTVPP